MEQLHEVFTAQNGTHLQKMFFKCETLGLVLWLSEIILHFAAPESNRDASFCPAVPLPLQLSAYGLKSSRRWSKSSGLFTYIRELDKALRCWLRTGPVLVLAAIWVMWKILSLTLPLSFSLSLSLYNFASK